MIASRSLENCRLFMVSPPIWGTGCHCSETYKYHDYPFVRIHVLLPKPVPAFGRHALMQCMSRIDDPDQLGHGLVEFRRNHLVDIDLFVERARQRNVLEYRDGMLCGDLSYLESDQILPLCHDDRSGILLRLVAQCYGKMSRICDDERCRRHGVDHATARTVAAQRTQARLDQRI